MFILDSVTVSRVQSFLLMCHYLLWTYTQRGCISGDQLLCTFISSTVGIYSVTEQHVSIDLRSYIAYDASIIYTTHCCMCWNGKAAHGHAQKQQLFLTCQQKGANLTTSSLTHCIMYMVRAPIMRQCVLWVIHTDNHRETQLCASSLVYTSLEKLPSRLWSSVCCFLIILVS